ncbi:hypothetical protein [Novosphingobium sp. AP12]|nr:hypothetical protein [Novosphingobium sp. AP12]
MITPPPANPSTYRSGRTRIVVAGAAMSAAAILTLLATLFIHP